MNFLPPNEITMPIPKENPMTFGNSQTFHTSDVMPNGKRDKVLLYPVSHYSSPEHFTVSADEISIVHRHHEDFGITKPMCGHWFEIYESVSVCDLYTDVVIIVKDRQGAGSILRSVANWAIEKIVSLESDPQYYV